MIDTSKAGNQQDIFHYHEKWHKYKGYENVLFKHKNKIDLSQSNEMTK